jgi:hypothetical protein
MSPFAQDGTLNLVTECEPPPGAVVAVEFASPFIEFWLIRRFCGQRRR